MKKFSLLIFTIFLSVTKLVYAEEIWTEEELKGDNVVSEYRYRFYEEVEEGEYLENNNNKKYEYNDESRNIYGEYSEWKSYCSTGDNIDIQRGLKFIYNEIIPINYLKIENNNNTELKINKVKIYNKDTILNDSLYSCVNCNNNKDTIYKNGYMVYQFSSEIKVGDIKFDIDIEGSDLEYNIILSNDETFSDKKLVSSLKGNSNNKSYKYNNDFKLYRNFTDPITGYNISFERYYNISNTYNVCRYRYVKKYYYNILKVYFDDNYYKDVSELGIPEESYDMYKKDLNDYKIYYRYKTLEELENEEDNIIVTPINNDTIPVKTGIFKEKDYKYLVIYVLTLILIALILIKHMQNKSTKNNN